MNDQHNNCGTTRTNCGCGTTRTNCGCGNTRTNCGCAVSRTPARALCDCGDNSWRTYPRTGEGCGCNNGWRTYPRIGGSCGCNNSWRNYSRTNCGCSAQRITEQEGCGCNRNTLRTATETTWKSGNCGQSCPSPVCQSCAQGAPADACLSGRSLAMVYSPHQSFENLYDSREGLCNGTVFCDLNKPFLASGR